MRLLGSLTLALVAVSAHAAQLVVHLPENAAIKVTDATPPETGLRIDCPPTCSFQNPGSSVGIFDLKVEPKLDPRTNDRPWDIVDMPGCRGTSALPADNAKCFLPTEGAVDIHIVVRYRPMLAVTYGGSYGGPLAGFYITANFGPGYQGSGASYSCDITRNPQTSRCAAHFTADQPLTLTTPPSERAAFISASAPCSAQQCAFTLTEDTCVSYLFQNGNPALFPTQSLVSIDCPTGPGTEPDGGGGGGGGAVVAGRRRRSSRLSRIRRSR